LTGVEYAGAKTKPASQHKTRMRRGTPVGESEVGKHPKESEAEVIELVLPNDANTLGNVLGGKVMHWVDVAAAIAAKRHCRRTVVTAAVDGFSFHHPIKVGQVAILRAKVTYASTTSMEVKVRVEAEDLNTGNRVRTSDAYLTFVALDDFGKPTHVPPLVPETDEEKAEYEAAIERRKKRLAHREK